LIPILHWARAMHAMEPSVLIDASYAAMQRAVELARSGQCRNWWTVHARMRISGYNLVDLQWTEAQREWLDLLCAEAHAGQNGKYCA
jgi:hypothetical protein